MIFEVTHAWKTSYPGAHLGVLAMRNAANPAQNAELERQRQALEGQLREQFIGQDRHALLAHPVLQAYERYYKYFKKTYHLQLQLESVLFKGKSIPGGAGLVEAMFMAELKNLLLTAGHDLDIVKPPVRLDITKGGERYTLLRGESQVLKPDDMYIYDEEGILSSIIYGPDLRTRIRESTRNVLFTVYAPVGIDPQAILAHLQDIADYIRLVAPNAQVEMKQVFGATD